MTAANVRKLVDATPFQPFEVHLSDGRVIPVQHREFIAVSPKDISFVVYQPDGDIDIVSTSQVTSLKLHERKRRSTKRR